MTYESKRIDTDPFCIMCGEGQMAQIEYWVEITEEELKTVHEECMMLDKEVENGVLVPDGEWEMTPKNFSEWLKQEIEQGNVREIVEKGA